MSDKQIKVTALDGSKYIVCGVVDDPHPKLDHVCLHLCVDDGGLVQPESGHSMPRYVAELWMQGHVRVMIHKPGGAE